MKKYIALIIALLLIIFVQNRLIKAERKAKENRRIADDLSRHVDALTSVRNKGGYSDYITMLQERLERNEISEFAVCMFDCDDLKYINDKFGHDDGDFALREIAAILNDTFRSTDVIGRLGGDEFVAFALVGVENYGVNIKDRISQITKAHNEAANKPYPIEMSTGVCEFICSENVDIFELLEQADEKLYIEKNLKKAKNGSYR